MNDKKFISTNVRKSLRKLFGNPNLKIYENQRLEKVSMLVSSILIKGDSRLNQLALTLTGRKKYTSKVKQFKRLVKNKYINFSTYYQPYIKTFLRTISASGLLVFSIDGSQVGQGCMCLMLSVIYQDKAIPVVWKTYKAKKGHLSESAHRALLEQLSKLVPKNCRVVITGDGEFDGCDWQQDILNQKWDYVVKTGVNSIITEDGWDEFRLGSVCIESGNDFFLENIGFTKKGLATNLLIWYGEGYKKPLYLVTNLDEIHDIKVFYKKRFKIEPFFRDQKSKGFNIHKSGLQHPERLDKLLIGTCLAYLLSIMAGVKARKSVFYDEIAEPNENDLSLFQLGYRFLLHLVSLRQWRTFSWEYDFSLI